MSNIQAPSGKYKIVGVIDLPALSLHPDTITYKGSAAELFCNSDYPYDMDLSIFAGITAFSVLSRNMDGSLREAFVAIVRKVITYEISDEKDLRQARVNLKFEYDRAPNVLTGQGVAKIEPLLSHIYRYDTFAALIYEGGLNIIYPMVTGTKQTIELEGKLYRLESIWNANYSQMDLSGQWMVDLASLCIGEACAAAVYVQEVPPARVAYANFIDQTKAFIHNCYGDHIYIEEVNLP